MSLLAAIFVCIVRRVFVDLHRYSKLFFTDLALHSYNIVRHNKTFDSFFKENPALCTFLKPCQNLMQQNQRWSFIFCILLFCQNLLPTSSTMQRGPWHFRSDGMCPQRCFWIQRLVPFPSFARLTHTGFAFWQPLIAAPDWRNSGLVCAWISNQTNIVARLETFFLENSSMRFFRQLRLQAFNFTWI